jgi:hypothetical protein
MSQAFEIPYDSVAVAPVEQLPAQPETASYSKWAVVAAATTLAMTAACGSSEKMTPDEQWHKPATNEIEQPIGTVRSPWGDLPIRQFRVDIPTNKLGTATEFDPSDRVTFDDGLAGNAVKAIIVTPKSDGAKMTYKYERGANRSEEVAQPRLYIKPGESHLRIKQHGEEIATSGIEWKTNVTCEKPIPHVNITTSVELDTDDRSLLCGVFKRLSPFYITDRHVIIEQRQEGANSSEQDHFTDEESAIVLDAPFEQDRGHDIRQLVARHESGHAVYADLPYSTKPDMQQKVNEAYEHLSDIAGSKHGAAWSAITENTYYKKYWDIKNNYGHPKDNATEGFASFSVAASLFPEDFVQQLNQLPPKQRQALARFGLSCFDSYLLTSKGGIYDHRHINSAKEITKLFPQYGKVRAALAQAAA